MSKNNSKEKIRKAVAKTEDYLKNLSNGAFSSKNKRSSENDFFTDEEIVVTREELKANDRDLSEINNIDDSNLSTEEELIEAQQRERQIQSNNLSQEKLRSIQIKDDVNYKKTSLRRDIEEEFSTDDSTEEFLVDLNRISIKELDDKREKMSNSNKKNNEKIVDNKSSADNSKQNNKVSSNINNIENTNKNNANIEIKENATSKNVNPKNINSNNQTPSDFNKDQRLTSEEQKISLGNTEENKKRLDDIDSLNLGALTHEKFVALVKSYPDFEDKIKMMGKRISFLNLQNKQLSSLNQQLKDKSVKLLGDYNSAKKRFEADGENIKHNTLKSFLKEIIGNIDIFETALNVENPSDELKNWLIGFKMIFKNLFTTLTNNGVTKIESKPGDKPDYNLHHIVEVIETDEVPNDTIYKTIQEGYLLDGKLLRVASVAVAKNKDKK